MKKWDAWVDVATVYRFEDIEAETREEAQGIVLERARFLARDLHAVSFDVVDLRQVYERKE